MNLPIELKNYDIQLTLTGNTAIPINPPVKSPPFRPTQINEAFRFTLTDFKVPFDTITNYYCVLAYDDWSRYTGIPGSEDVVLGSAKIEP
ncbi:8234_t:CDS:1, partial [Ambispora gerdemannii]